MSLCFALAVFVYYKLHLRSGLNNTDTDKYCSGFVDQPLSDLGIHQRVLTSGTSATQQAGQLVRVQPWHWTQKTFFHFFCLSVLSLYSHSCCCAAILIHGVVLLFSFMLCCSYVHCCHVCTEHAVEMAIRTNTPGKRPSGSSLLTKCRIPSFWKVGSGRWSSSGSFLKKDQI